MPDVIVIAGPNGAGKSTLAPYLLRDRFGILEFVNADTIALGLSAFSPESAALDAGRVMLSRLRELATEMVDFAFETTLASRFYARWLERLRSKGYRVHMLFLWLPSADFAVERVAQRVRAGGHNVPEESIRRRYKRGLHNLCKLYLPIADSWQVYDGSENPPELIAFGDKVKESTVVDAERWKKIER